MKTCGVLWNKKMIELFPGQCLNVPEHLLALLLAMLRPIFATNISLASQATQAGLFAQLSHCPLRHGGVRQRMLRNANLTVLRQHVIVVGISSAGP